MSTFIERCSAVCPPPFTTGTQDAKKHMVSNLSTVAVVPVTHDVPLETFTSHLCAALNTIGESVGQSMDICHLVCVAFVSSIFTETNKPPSPKGVGKYGFGKVRILHICLGIL